MTDRLKRITRKACEEIAKEQGIRHWDAVLTHPKLRKLAHERIDEKLREENEPKWVPRMSDEDLVEVMEPEENGGATIIEMELEVKEEEDSGIEDDLKTEGGGS